MLEELSISLVNSLIFSAMVFFPLHLTGDFILFWLIFLTTTSIGIGAHRASHPDIWLCVSLSCSDKWFALLFFVREGACCDGLPIRF